MTRELHFFNDFEFQLAAFTGWRCVSEQMGSNATLAFGDYPCFETTPGQARYGAYDSLGTAGSGEQDFVLRVRFAHPQCAWQAVRITHAEYVGTIEQFFSGGYIAPAIDPGDHSRIDSLSLVSIEPAITSKTATHTTLVVRGKYYFSLF